MMVRRAALLVLVLVLVACGGDEKKGTVELTQVFESETGVTVKLPDGWVARDIRGAVEILTDTALDVESELATSGTFPDDGMMLSINIMSWDGALWLAELDPAGDVSIPDIVSGMASKVVTGYPDGDVSKTQVAGKDAGRIKIAHDDFQAEGFILGYRYDDETFIWTLVQTHKGNLDKHEKNALNVIESIQYAIPEEEENWTPP